MAFGFKTDKCTHFCQGFLIFAGIYVVADIWKDFTGFLNADMVQGLPL